MGKTPWLGGPITLHAWRMYECELPEKSQCEYAEGYWRFWYEADHRYGVPTTAFFLATIIMFAIPHLFAPLVPRAISQSKAVRRWKALARFLSYKGFRVRAIGWNSGPLGVLLLGAIGTLFFLCMILAPKPFYWPNTATVDYGSSPPIATRAGWLSLGCMPFVFATAGKSNLITAVTGVSHERLQVFHRWISYAFFVTALVHTFPFIVYNISTGTMKEQWNISVFYWTGVVALVAQGWLTFASFSPLRSISYEFFKASHLVAALIFMLFLFFHCDYTLSAWDYFIVTGVLFSLSWLHRQIKIHFEHGIHHRAKLSLASNGFVRVQVPTTATWQAGQHFFIRFLSFGIHSWTTHPFTACSLPQPANALGTSESQLVFFIRPQGGLTKLLEKHAQSCPESSMRVVIDGPYGGINIQKLHQFQRQVVVAGGSGAGWILPIVSAFLRKHSMRRVAEQISSASSLVIILATRDMTTRLWFEDELRRLLMRGGLAESPPNLRVKLFYTGSVEDAEAQIVSGLAFREQEKSDKAADVAVASDSSDVDSDPDLAKPLDLAHISGRPDLGVAITSEVRSSGSQERTGVFVCGPLSMQHDVSNAVASEQLGLVKDGSKEVYLHVEHFSWA